MHRNAQLDKGYYLKVGEEPESNVENVIFVLNAVGSSASLPPPKKNKERSAEDTVTQIVMVITNWNLQIHPFHHQNRPIRKINYI